MANILGVNCSVKDGLGRLTIVISQDNQIITKIYKSPSIFSFKENIGEILNWHKDNVLSLISLYEINAIVIRKTERSSFRGKPKKSDFFKLYLEGVMLSLAGMLGIQNKHLEKANIKRVLGDNIDEQGLKDIIENFQIEIDSQPQKTNEETITETLLTVLAYKATIE